MRANLSVIMALVVGMGLGGILIGSLVAGTVEPPGSAVDGSGNPKPTGSTPGAWDKALPANDTGDPCNSSRFTCVLPDLNFTDGAAVRDNETGLVWERSPGVLAQPWNNAIRDCNTRTVGNRLGWTLPTANQLGSLVDPTNPGGNPDLPLGHPFQNLPANVFLSASSLPGVQTSVYSVSFTSGSFGTNTKTSTQFFWCVRGNNTWDGNSHITTH